ncbi:S-layer homology domain-containing protein [Oscillospiraceae bacterium CM]|nr:S-layer homology domain-containing protein [Oscillospiraceae bacterium CM]
MKRLAAAALVLCALFCFSTATAAGPGSSTDPLASLSYLNSTFAPDVNNSSKTLISNSLAPVYDNAARNAQSIYNAALSQLGGYSGYAFTDKIVSLRLPSGTSASFVTGSMVSLVSGKATLTVTKGTVIDVSTGTELKSPAALTSNGRYLCAEDTTATLLATADTVCQIDGYYQTNGTIVQPVLYSDVRSTDWFVTAVSYVSDNGFFSGTTATTFSPQTSMTRGMFVTVLYRLAGKPAVSGGSSFSDVASTTAYYYQAVIWASSRSIVTGYSDGKFHPDDIITREQMAAVMYRYAASSGYDTAPGSSTLYQSFPDVKSVSAYAADAMTWSVNNGLISGSGGKLLPKSTASRAQVAQIVYNFCQNIL